MESVYTVIDNFNVSEGEIIYCERYGEGHINDTYLVIIKDKNNCENNYILQRINNSIFQDVEGLMNNIASVTCFLREIVECNGGDTLRETLNLVPTNEGKNYFQDGNDFYRVYVFVNDTITYQTVENADYFKECAISFGRFQNNLKKFDASKLVEVIPNFHNTRSRFNHFKMTLAADKCNRAKDCKEEIDFVLSREHYVDVVVDMIKNGQIPVKLTHNDTKLNNILFDKTTNKGICVIDLDTIMPGSILYDVGDSIRFGCNPVAEDEKDLSKVVFSLPYFKSYMEGYLSEAKNSLNDKERELLPFCGLLMTLECGIRFLDDYLDGDNYFKVHREGQNLDRCRTQFKLVCDMENNMDAMVNIVKNILEN